MRRVPVVLAAVLGLGAVAPACGSGSPPPERAAAVAGRVTVLAAASLTEVLPEVGAAFADAHPGVDVAFSFGASSALARQANEGAPADVFAAADEASMAMAVDGGSAVDPVVFARNRLALLVGRGNPKGLTGLADLARPGVGFVACALEVPCGRLAAEALHRAGVAVEPKSYEENVKAVVAKVTLGEADAGIVYATDARAAGERAGVVDIPDALDVVASYPAAVLRQSPRPEAARALLGFLVSDAGGEILVRHGFLLPRGHPEPRAP